MRWEDSRTTPMAEATRGRGADGGAAAVDSRKAVPMTITDGARIEVRGVFEAEGEPPYYGPWLPATVRHLMDDGVAFTAMVDESHGGAFLGRRFTDEGKTWRSVRERLCR